MVEQASPGKSPLGRREALAMARGAKKIIAGKGTRVTELDMSKRPSDAEVLEVMLGPTGNLRAPVMRVGDTIYVGFPKEGFEQLK